MPTDSNHLLPATSGGAFSMLSGNSRFELIRQLGEGGFGVVFEAFDRKRSSRVALKVLRRAEGATLYRFKREFRALAEVSHRNLVALYDLLTDGRHWFFTMELVRGTSIINSARPAQTGIDGTSGPCGCLDETKLRLLLPQLVDALDTIHHCGIVHRDIKPSNVLVTPEDRLVLLDFGIVSEREGGELTTQTTEDSAQEVVVLGTPAYMAPEQGTFETVTPAADWYSVGVILYEALTGVLPFSGSTVQVLEAKRARAPRPPEAVNHQVPADLADLCMKLLSQEPARRPGATAIRELIGGAAPRVETVGAARETLVGREPHLRRLDQAFETMMRGQTVVAFVSGPSGMGKTSLLRRFLQRQRSSEPTLLSLTSRCYERESLPYQALDPLVDTLARHLRRLTDIEVARLLPRDAAILARVFPVLLGVEEIRRAPAFALESLGSVTLRQRAVGALRDLLFALGIRVPLLLAIDDAQWGDVDSALVLQQVLAPPDAPPLLLLVAYRSEDADEAPLIRALRKATRDVMGLEVCDVELGALAESDAEQLARQLTASGNDDPGRAHAIARESGGSPFFVHELSQHAALFGGVPRLDVALLNRLEALPPTARRLLTAIALSTQSVAADVAQSAAGLDPDDRASLQVLRAAKLVRTIAGLEEPTFEPYHDRIREAVISQLSDGEVLIWHGQMAAAWEHSGRARPETLMAHYLVARNDEKTRYYAAQAAEKAEAALAFDRAADFYGILVQLEVDAATRHRWLIKLGETLVNGGRGREAATAFLSALPFASGNEAIELERRAAAELIRAGYLDEATEVLDRLLPKIRVKLARSNLRVLFSLFGYRLLLRLRGSRFRERPESEVPADELRRIDVLTSIAAPLSLVALGRGAALNTQATWYALRAGERRRVVVGLASLAASSAASGTRTVRRSERLLKEARALAAPLNHAWTTGQLELAEGIVLKVNGKWKEGVRRLESAIGILNSTTGVRWEVETAQTLIHDALYWMGAWRRLALELPSRRQEAEHRGDRYSSTHVAARLSPVVHMAADRVEQARAEAQTGLASWTRRDVHLQHRWSVCSGIDIDLYTGQAAEAAARLSAAWPALRGILFLFQNGRIEMVFYRARIALALAAQGDRKALRRARADAWRLEHEGAAWASALAMLVRATVARGHGERDTATTLLERAEEALRHCDMHHYAAAAQYRRGQLIGGAEGDRLMRSAVDWMHEEQMVNPARMLDLLTPGPWATDSAA